MRSKISLTARILGDALDWVKKSPPKSFFRRLFLETRLLLVPIMSASTKDPTEVLKDSKCERGNIVNRSPILYVQPVDPNEKQEKSKIKVKLPDRTNYHLSKCHLVSPFNLFFHRYTYCIVMYNKLQLNKNLNFMFKFISS